MLTDILLNDESCADLRMAVEKVPKLKTKFEVHNTVLQVLVLETMHQPQKLLCVANTHLYFHPYAGHQRLLQAAVSLRHLRNVCQYYVQQVWVVSFNYESVLLLVSSSLLFWSL